MSAQKTMPSDFRFFAWLFITTGVFAIVGALFTWGDGWLFVQEDLAVTIIPFADLVVAGPISLVAGVDLWFQSKRGFITGAMAVGIYIFGSIQVYYFVWWEGLYYAWQLIIPPIFGLGIAFSFIYWTLSKPLFRS